MDDKFAPKILLKLLLKATRRGKDVDQRKFLETVGMTIFFLDEKKVVKSTDPHSFVKSTRLGTNLVPPPKPTQSFVAHP